MNIKMQRIYRRQEIYRKTFQIEKGEMILLVVSISILSDKKTYNIICLCVTILWIQSMCQSYIRIYKYIST